jgi:predicted nucleic acid-binding protein
MKYVLDTNIVSYSINRRSPFHTNVIAHLSRIAESDTICISVLTFYEAEYGILSVTPEHKERVSKAREIMLRPFDILPVSIEGAHTFGHIKRAYRKKTGISQKILDQHNIDFILASSAIAENATLVSNDKIFLSVRDIEPTLRLENWAV